MASYRLLIIAPDGTVHKHEGGGQEPPLAVLQEAVDGYIELVWCRTVPGVKMWVNEDGRLRGMTPNRIATRLASMGDTVVGTVAIENPPDDWWNASQEDWRKAAM